MVDLVEVARGRLTSDEAHRKTIDFIEGLGKKALLTKDMDVCMKFYKCDKSIHTLIRSTTSMLM
jgi:hypothetical protein